MAKSKFVDVTLRLIDKMSPGLNSVGASLAESNRQWQRAGRQITKTGKNIESVGKGMTTSLTVPILGAGTAAVKLASDFEAGMSKVQSICGATGQELDLLSEKAKEMGAQTKYSATEATEAFSYMAMAGWNTQQMLDGIEGVMYLAGATGEDLALTSDIVTDALTAFGLAASDTNEFVDVLAMTANKSNTSVSMLGESFQYVAPVAGALGYSVQDVSTALGLMANSGVKASIAGTALRSWMSRMSAPTDAVQKAMDKLNISLTDSSGNMLSFEEVMKQTKKAFSGLTEAEKAQYASVLAGKQGMSGLLAIVNSADSEFDELSKSIEKSNGACKEMYDVANDNLQGQLTILKSTVESVAIAFGERMTPYVKTLTTYAQKLAEKINGLSDSQMDMIIKVLGVVAALGPAVLFFGKMVTVIGNVVTMVGKFGAAFKAAGSIGAMVTGPVGIAIAAVTALIAAGVLLYKNWDKVKEGAKKAFSYVKSIFKELGVSGDSIKEKLSPLSEKFIVIKDKLKELWVTVEPLVSAMGEVFKFNFAIQIGSAVGMVIGFVTNLIDTIVDVASGMMTAFEGVIDFLTGVFTGNWKKAWEGVKTIFKGTFESLVALAKYPINAVISLINGAIAGINKLGLTIPEWVPGLGGKEFKINIPQIPTLAKGTQNWKGGIVQISERGGEIVDLPSGSRVYPHDESVQKAYNDGVRSKSGGIVINISKLADKVEIRDDSDIDRIAERIAEKLEKTSQNLGGGELGYLY